MRCLCSTSWPTLAPHDILCGVLCCAYAYAKVCVWGGGGAHRTMLASSVLVFISICVLPLHTDPTLVSLRCDTCMNVFVLVVF